ncbi:MAG: envelope integrity protein Cei [Pseudonocardiaceae bacterium]|nr:envelope integrity protein Cei [Pseudonocardiaceae bacterium]
MPGVVLLALLGVVSVVVWTTVLGPAASEAIACPPPSSTAPPYSGDTLPRTALDTVAPAPPQLASIRVLNANGMRGEASIVSEGLTGLGFVTADAPINDPLHPDFGLSCHGQIRFGTQGEPAARTISLVVPCAQLVRDVRTDDVVDLSLGTEFIGLRPSAEARSALRSLAQLGEPAPPSDGEPRGGQVGDEVQPTIDPELVQAARHARC